MNRESSLKRLNPSHALLIFGMLLALLAVMFRPAGAEATLPTSLDVFSAWDEATPATVKVGDLPTTTDQYKVILKGQSKGTFVDLTGVPLIEVLKHEPDVNLDNVQFVKIRFGNTDDSSVSLQPLYQGSPRPPMILESGKKPGFGPFATPAIVPGQPNLSTSLKESQFTSFSAKGPRLSIKPAKPGAKIMSVRIESKQLKSGEYKLTAKVSGGTSASKKYQWYGFDSKGNSVTLGTGPSYTTTDATSGTATRKVNLYVEESGTQSMGVNGFSYTSKKKAKGATKNPYPPTPQTSAPTNTTVPGVPQANVTGGGVPGGAATTVPPANTTAPTSSTSVPPPSQPTASTGQTSPAVDTTAITNAAQNVSGSGGLKTVSGVLLSSPTAAPAAAGGGSAISALPAPVATELNTIFKPVDSTEDVWAYLVALLFAFSFSGAVREWVNP